MPPAARITTIPVIIASFSWRRWCCHHRGGAVPISSTDGLSHCTPVGAGYRPTNRHRQVVDLVWCCEDWSLCGQFRFAKCCKWVWFGV